MIEVLPALALLTLPSLTNPYGRLITMSSIKCAHCGLLNFSDAENCKRCRAALQRGEDAPPKVALPIQSVGAWRDRWWLVKQVTVPLVDGCIKCSESADVNYKSVSVKAYSAWSLVTQLAGVRIFRMIPVDVPLCRRHRSAVDKITIGIILAGLALCVLGVALMQMSSILPVVLFMAGFLVIPAGIDSPRACESLRFKDPYIWLWGVHRSYLEGRPEWSKRQAR